MFDILTVVYEREVSMLKLQAISIAKYAKDVGKIVIIINGRTPDSVSVIGRRLRSEVIPCYGDLADHVEIYSTISLAGRCFGFNGWESQQLLKLMSGVLCKNLMVILDAKDFFIKPFDEEDLYNSADGRIKCRQKDVEEWSWDHLFRACQLFDLDEKQYKDMINNNRGVYTPFIIRPQTLRDCCAEIESISGMSIVDFFPIDFASFLEFYLMSAYIAKKHGLDFYYCDDSNIEVHKCHRTVYQNMTEQERLDYADWLSIGEWNLLDTQAARGLVNEILLDLSIEL